MKQLILTWIFVICTLSLTAQTKYLATGFAGKDTMNLGIISLDSKGMSSINLGTYRGVVQLVPVDSSLTAITKHLQYTGSINSEAALNAAKSYISDTLSFGTLYHSGLWKEYIQQWVGFYAQSSENPEKFAETFVPVAKQVLARTSIENSEAASVLSKDLINFFEQFNLTQATENIAVFTMGMDIPYGEHSEIASRLVLAQNLTGKQSPPLSGIENTLTKVILFFYESGCHNCESQMSDLKTHYSDIMKKGFRVISISADNDQNVFAYHSKDFPWPDKLCDYKGFGGDNFKRFGVASTPNLFVIDAEGKVVGRYARLSETGLIPSSENI